MFADGSHVVDRYSFHQGSSFGSCPNFHARVQRRDAERERDESHARQTVGAHPIGQPPRRRGTPSRSPAGMSTRRGGLRDTTLAEHRQQVAEVPAVRPAEQPVPRLRELQHSHRAARLRLRGPSPTAPLSVSVTLRRAEPPRPSAGTCRPGTAAAVRRPSTKRTRSDAPRRAALSDARTSISRQKSAPMIGNRPRRRRGRRPGRGRRCRWQRSRIGPAPDPRGDQFSSPVAAQARSTFRLSRWFEQVVARRDVVEHPADARLALVEQCGHGCLSVADGRPQTTQPQGVSYPPHRPPV